MATVYITKELISRLENKIDSMRLAERRSDVPLIDQNHNIDASMLFNIGCWGASHVHLLALTPKDWLTKMDAANISISGTTEEGRELRTNVRFTGMTYAYCRPKGSYYSTELTLAEVRAFPEETVGRAELLKRWDDAVVDLALTTKWAKVRSDITEFLHKCKSLNEAVKLYPGVRLYIDREDIERMERPTQRAKIVDALGTEGLTAAAIAAKLAMAAYKENN